MIIVLNGHHKFITEPAAVGVYTQGLLSSFITAGCPLPILVFAYVLLRSTGKLAWAGMTLVIADLLMLGYVRHRVLQVIDLPPRKLFGRLVGFTTSHGVA